MRPRRRLHGLSAEDVAELIGVSVQRVAAVLQLDENGSAQLCGLALAEANAAAAYYERSAFDGAARALSGIRRFSSPAELGG